MSKETVQFAELLRKAAAAINPPSMRLHYCEQCGMQKPHMIKLIGRDEIYKCLICGYEKWYTVR
jgi:hypothetical protein